MLEFHPLADLYPLIEGEDFDALAASVRDNDVRELIWMFEGKILDGRNRYRAARAAGKPWVDEEERHWTEHADAGKGGIRRTPHFVLYDPKVHGDPLDFVVDLNDRRRHESPSQRALRAARIATLRPGRPSEWQHGSADQVRGRPAEGAGKPASLPDLSHVEPPFRPRTQEEAAGMMHVSERSVRTARDVVEHGAAELVERVERGEVTVSAAAEVARLPVADQLDILRAADPRALAKVARERRDALQADKKTARTEREQALGARQLAAPALRYGVILADPPWRFEPRSRESGMDRAADNHYPTATLEEIVASHPVAEAAADDCVLFLWATAPMLPQALAAMAAWGFAYKTHAIWRKAEKVTGVHTWSGKGSGIVIGTGYWFRSAHELLLVGVRGNVPAPAMGTQLPSVFDAPPLQHSAKPEAVYELVERYFPTLPKIEFNARRRREGWDAWGLEAPEEGSPEDLAVGTGSPKRLAEGQSVGKVVWLLERPATRDEAEPILRARYDGANAAALAEELHVPIGTIRTWVFRLGLTERARLAARGADMVKGFNAGRAGS